MKKNRLVPVLIILGIIVVLILAVPFLVNADAFRPAIQSQLQTALNRQVTIGSLSLSLLSGGVTADNIVISDDPAFSASPFLKAKSLAVGVKLMPLIFSRSLQVTGVTLAEPELSLIHSSSGKWNFSSLGSGKKSPSSSAPAGNLPIATLKIVNGRVTVASTGARKASVYENVNVTASNVGYDFKIPFTLDAKTPGGGKLKVEGTAGPVNSSDAALSPLEAQVSIDNMDLASTGFIDPESGIGGVLDYKGMVKSDGRTAHSQGEAKIDTLKVVRAGSPAKQPVILQYASDYNLQREAGVLTRGDLRTGNSTVHLTGDYDAHGPSTVVHMKLNGSQIPVKDIEGLLPAMGVTLPAGASLQSGTMNANFALDGPIDRLITTGTAQLSNARLAGYDLASKMKVLSALSGLQSSSADTVIETLSSNLRLAPEGIRADNLNVIVPALGSLTGNGTIGANNTLNFHMVAKLAQSNSTVGQLTRNIPVLGAGGGRGGSIPFMVQGTTSQPVFVPDVAGALAGTVANPLQQQQNQQQQNPLGGLVQGIFGGKKK